MHSDASRTGESNSKRNDWPPMKLLCGISSCLGLAFIWLAWSTYHTSHVANLLYVRQIHIEALRGIFMQLVEVLTMSAVLTAWLGIWYVRACRRQHRRLLSSLKSGEHEPPAIAVSENEAHYWELFENASDFVYTLDIHGHFTAVNKTGERLLGYARDELVCMKLADIMPPESLTYSRQMHITKEAGAAWATYEVEVITKDNHRVPLEVSTRLLYRGSKPVGLQGIARDMTKRKQAEEALQQAHDEPEDTG